MGTLDLGLQSVAERAGCTSRKRTERGSLRTLRFGVTQDFGICTAASRARRRGVAGSARAIMAWTATWVLAFGSAGCSGDGVATSSQACTGCGGAGSAGASAETESAHQAGSSATPGQSTAGASTGGGGGVLSSGPECCTVVSGDEAQTAVNTGALLVDVRVAAEFEAYHLASAINLPLDTLPDAMSGVAEASTEQPIVVYCNSGRQSGLATTALCEAGYCIYDLGALTNWPE